MAEKFEVVISGVSGRFPECEDIDTFKKMLYNKENPITYDNRKWPVGYKYKFGEETVPIGTGKYTQIEKFDARVFSCSAMLAKCTDILNRKVLEPSFEAVMDAGINPSSLMGANIGCYMSTTIGEIESIKIFSKIGDKMYLLGGSKAMLSNRISFALNLTGPSYTYYSGVLGGLEGLSTAYENIREGRIDAALVGCSSSIVDPKISLSFLRLGYLSPDALCRAFDADANGYGRSEATVLMFLQRSQDAKRSYGTLLFSDYCYLGTNPLTFIGYEEQIIENSLKRIYAKHNKIKPSEVSYLEMDACGVKHLEKVEANAIANVFCEDREEALLIGSVKSFCGHAEASAALLSLLKTLFALDSDRVAPNMHFSKPNPQIKPLVDGKLKVVSEVTELPGSIVAINSFGITGSVSHAVVKQNSRMNESTDFANDILPRLVLVCGRTEDGLRSVMKKIESMPLNKEFVSLTNDVFKMPIQTHVYRGYTILPASDKSTGTVEAVNLDNRPIWFVFSGMGSQWNGMGRGLLDIPIFADAIDRCDAVLQPRGIDIRHILTSDDPSLFDNILNAFLGIITVQIGLVNILRSVGIEPDGIIGHSVGENACAYADGCLTLEQAVLASHARGVASNEAETIKGMMAAIGKGYDQIKDSLPEDIEVACHNSADNCTLTGPAEKVNQFVEILQKQNIFARTVNVSNIAYHSKYIAPAGPILLERLREVITQLSERSSRWISTSVPESDWDTPRAKYCSAEYLTNNLVSSVLFEEGCKRIPENAVVIEIAPHGLLQAILKRSLSHTCTNVSLTLRSKESNSINFLLSAIGKLFIAGCQPDVNALYPKISYPVPRGTPSISSLATWDHADNWMSIEPVNDKPLSEEIIKIAINKGSKFNYINGHQIDNQKIIPPSLYMYLVWHILSILKNVKLDNLSVVFENIKIYRNLRITLEKHRGIMIMIQYGSGNFEILLNNDKKPESIKPIMTGRIGIPFDKIDISLPTTTESKIIFEMTGNEFYNNLENFGYRLQDEFVNIRRVAFGDTESSGRIIWNKNWVCLLDSLMKLYVYADINQKRELLLPTRIRKLVINTSSFEALKQGDEISCHVDLITKQLRCDGLEITDLRYDRPAFKFFDSLNASKLQSLHFVANANPDVQDIPAFVELTLQLGVENIGPTANDQETKMHVIDTTSSMHEIVRNIMKRNRNLKSNVVISDPKDSMAETTSIKNDYFIIVNELNDLEKSCSHIGHKLNNLFVLLVSTESLYDAVPNGKLLTEVMKKDFGKTYIRLYKKILENEDQLPVVMLATDKWATKIIADRKVKKPRKIVLVKYNVESADLNVIISKRNRCSNIRYLFIVDEDAPKFSTDNPIYRSQIMKDLAVSVLKDGQWGSYRNLGNNTTLPCDKLVSPVERTSFAFSLKHVDVKYVSRESVAEEQELNIMENEDGIEYSGVTDTGNRIMGLSTYNCKRSQERDPYFTWTIPKRWSLEDACTVPLIYSQVYNVLFLSPQKETRNSIFVNTADLSFMEAFLAVSLHHSYSIYTTVSHEGEAIYLKRKFPLLEESRILRRNQEYDLQLKLLTKGYGADLVINCVPGSKHLNASINCLANFGHYVEMTDGNRSAETEIGLFLFLKSTSFTYISNKISYFLSLPTESKRLLQNLVNDGIQEDVVTPLSRAIVNEMEPNVRKFKTEMASNVKKIYKFFDDESVPHHKGDRKLRFDDARSFIVISTGKKADLWLELVQWLIGQGARKLVVAIHSTPAPPTFSHLLNRLLLRKKATIVLTSAKRAETAEDARDLVGEANNIAPLGAIFFVSVDHGSPIVENVDNASRSIPACRFVSLFSGGLKECERRRKEGLPAVLIHSTRNWNTLTSVLPQLKQLLTQFDCKNSPLLYELSDESKTKGTDSTTVLSDYFNTKLEQLENVGYYATDTVQFVEVTFLSKKYSETKGVYPIFVIPSVDASSLKPLLKNIIYPVFSATFSENCNTVPEMASTLLKELQKIQPYGPVTLIGETWSGSIAVNLASLLQGEKRAVQLFLIEGSPFTWQQHIGKLGEINTSAFDRNLLKEILNVDLQAPYENDYNENDSYWRNSIEDYLYNLKCSEDATENIIKAINGIRKRLILTAQYTPPKTLLKHIILFKQTPSDSSLEKYSLSDEIHLIKNEKYEDFIQVPEISRIINENALFSWWR